MTAASEVKVVGTEANLSIPGYSASIPRPEWIAYAAQDLGGNAVEGRADGFLARIILHELDVLDGLAFFDHIGDAPTRLPSASAKATDALSQALSSAVGNSIAGPSQAEGEDEDIGISTPVTVSPELLAVRDTVLRWRAREVNFAEWSSDRLRELARRMFRIQYELEGVGLAAPQIGVSARLAVIDGGEGKPLVLINPEIIEKSPELEVGREGCLSLPGFSGQVSRSNAVTVKNVDVHGEEYEFKAEGYLARIIQHEVDHLDGVLYADHVENAPANLMSVDPHSKSLKSTDVVYRREQTLKD